jgi:photosystem II stability/assembly factor-like uncharacterized protein
MKTQTLGRKCVLKKRTLFESNLAARTLGLFLLVLFLLGGCDEEEEGPTGPAQTAWTRHDPVLEGNKLRAAAFAGENEGWIVGQDGVILRTTDGGNSWTTQTVSSFDMWDITFFDADSGWAVGEGGTLLRTMDGGLVWSPPLFDTIPDDIHSVVFKDDQEGLAVGESGTIVQTTNGGRTWARSTSGTDVTLRGVAGSENITVAVGDSGIVLRAVEATISSEWSIDTVGNGNLWAVTLVNNDLGWAVGEEGAIWSTTDGGLTWLDQSGNVSDTVTEILTDVHFTSAATGYIVGGKGTITTTANGGTNWTVQPAVSPHDLFGINFADQSNAWIVGDLTLLK